MDDHAGGHAQLGEDPAHPLGVALGEIVVHRHHVNALARQRVEIGGEGGDQRLAFTGAHLGDIAPVQHDAAHQLDVVMALAERALGGFANGGESFGQQLVQALAVFMAFAEFDGLLRQRRVIKLDKVWLQRIDLVHDGTHALDLAVVGGAEKLAGDVEHDVSALTGEQ